MSPYLTSIKWHNPFILLSILLILGTINLTAQNRQIESYIDKTISYRGNCNENGREEYTMNAGIEIDVLGWCYSNNRQCNAGRPTCTNDTDACDRTSSSNDDALLITVSIEGWEDDQNPRSVYNNPQDDCYDNGACPALDITTLDEDTYYEYTCSGNSHEVVSIIRWFYAPILEPDAFTVSGADCANDVYLNAITSTQDHVTWYWQGTNANGTSTIFPSTSNYSIASGGTYYLRARGDRNGEWSTTSRSLFVNNLIVYSSANNPGEIELSDDEICIGGNASIDNVVAATTGLPASSSPRYQFYWKRTTPPVTGYQLIATTNASSLAMPAAVTGTAGTYYFARYSAFKCSGGYATNVTSNDIGPFEVNTMHTSPTTVITDAGGAICSGTLINIKTDGIAGSNGSIDWYTEPNGNGTFIGTGDVIFDNPTSDIVYYPFINGNGCPDYSGDSVDVDVKTAKDNLVLPALTSLPNLIEQCIDNGWTYYGTAARPDEWLFAIRKNSQTSEPFFDVDLDDAGNVMGSLNTAGNAHGSYLMRRYWNVRLVAGSIANGIDVRFYYDHDDLNDAVAKRDTDFNNNNGLTKGPDPQWFKTSAFSGGFDPSLITPGMGNKWTFPYDHLPGILGTQNGISYVQFNGLTTLSGGTGGTTFGENNPLLPVEYASFTASPSESSIELNWMTLSETNNDIFEIWRSSDAINFEKIGEVDGKGNSSEKNDYSFMDRNIVKNTIYYYQLKQMDFDGSSQRSSIISAVIKVLDADFIVGNFVPNPAINATSLSIITTKNEIISYQIIDSRGQLIVEGDLDNSNSNTHQLIIDDVQAFANGVYIVNFFTKTALLNSRRLMVIH